MSKSCLELKRLKAQEQILLKLHMQFNDQLNRLKVEELALTNLMRLQKEREMTAQTGDQEVGLSEDTIEEETFQVLNLLVPPPQAEQEAEEEEEEDDDDDDSQAERMVKEGVELAEEDETGGEEADQSYNAQLATYLEELFLQQQEQNEQDQLILTPSQTKLLESSQEEEEEEKVEFIEQT